jgi:hypothetical protein
MNTRCPVSVHVPCRDSCGQRGKADTRNDSGQRQLRAATYLNRKHTTPTAGVQRLLNVYRQDLLN